MVRLSDKRIMKKVSIVLVVLLVVTLTATSVLAGGAVSNVVPNSLLCVPTADVDRYGDLTLGYCMDGNDSTFGITYGLTDQVEVGVIAQTYKNSNLKFSGVAKVRVWEETLNQPAVALGLADESVYAVASKQITSIPYLRGHLGFGAGDLDGFFFGITKVMNPITISRGKSGQLEAPMVTLMAELLKHDLNFGVRLDFYNNVEVDIGVKGGGNLVIGARYTMGL